MARLQSFSKMEQTKLKVLPLRCMRCAAVGTKKKPVKRYVDDVNLCDECVEVVEAQAR
jgi:hypothetical protein